MVIGLGTGRCGTVSLTKLFGGVHELEPILPWQKDDTLFEQHLEAMKESGNDFFVAYYYHQYLDYFLDTGAKVVCLRRDKHETINSFLWKMNRNYFLERVDDKWGASFPQVTASSIGDSVSRYYDIYYDSLYKYANHRNFRFFGMQDLDNPRWIAEFLERDYQQLTKKHNENSSYDYNLSRKRLDRSSNKKLARKGR